MKTLRYASAISIWGATIFGWIAGCDSGGGGTIPGTDGGNEASDSASSQPDVKDGALSASDGASSDGPGGDATVAFTYTLIDDMETTTKGPIQLAGISPPLNPGYWFNFGAKVPGDTADPAMMSFVFTGLPTPTTTLNGKTSAHAAHQFCSLNGQYDVCGVGFEFTQVPDLDAGGPEGGVADSGITDAAGPDSGTADARLTDGGGATDAAVADARLLDAGSDATDAAPPIPMTTVPFDISQYKGIVFWAKTTAVDAGPLDLKVQFPDTDTDPRGGVCNGAVAGASGPTDFSQCYNSYAAHKMVTGDWQQFTVLFKDLNIEGFGYMMPGPWDGKKVYGINWQGQKNTDADAGAVTADLWIDDVYFVQ